MAEKYRATMHNGRKRVSGEAYSAKHNDRNCPAGSNINPEPERRNRYFIANTDGTIETHPSKSFEEHEKTVYGQLFSNMLTVKNNRHRKAGHADRVRTMDDYLLRIAFADKTIMTERKFPLYNEKKALSKTR